MIRKFKRKMDYTNGSQGFLNNENIIPGQNITMQNTSIPLEGQALDANGYPIGNPVLMQPGFDYNFPNATSVQEKVIFQDGGYYSNSFNNPMNVNFGQQFTNPFSDQYLANTSFNYNLPEMTPEQKSESTQAMSGMYSDAFTGEVKSGGETTINTPVNQVEGDFQFFNPYYGTDLGSASFNLGQSIQNKDTLGTVASGLKMATGLARNFFSGMGVQNREQQVMEDYKRQQREALTQSNRPVYMQEGGEVVNQEQEMLQIVADALSQGIAPEQVLQGLIQNGIDEQTAQQIVETVMQQMNG